VECLESGRLDGERRFFLAVSGAVVCHRKKENGRGADRFLVVEPGWVAAFVDLRPSPD
jgi:hypothetical protein